MITVHEVTFYKQLSADLSMRRLGGIKSSGMGSSRLQVLRGILRELKLLSPVKVIK